jgi:hypothetical protein
MDCVACHPTTQLHGDGTAYPNRHAVKSKPSCVSCHPNAKAAGSPIEQHAVHGDKINCVVKVPHREAGHSRLSFERGSAMRVPALFSCPVLG